MKTAPMAPSDKAPMRTYVALGTFTDQGLRTIQDSPKRLAAVRKALVSGGAKLVAFYLLMGPYDFVGVLEAPNDETIAKYALAVAGQGAVKLTVVRAFTEPEYRQLIKGSP